MFTFHKPKVFRSANGCCICKAKSSSSRFTDSKRYESNFEKCFSLEEHRSGEICNACVLLVKRYMKLPAGSTRHWNHVVDARSGPGIKSMVKSKKKDQECNQETPEKINKKHFYKSKRKQQTVRQRNPSIPVSGFLDMSRWTKEKVCCGVIFRGPHGEVAIDPRFLNPCTTCKDLKEPLTPLSTGENSSNTNNETDDDASSVSSKESNPAPSSACCNSGKMEVDEVDDEGFFDKPAVSPSESGASTPPPMVIPEGEDLRLVVNDLGQT